MKLYTSLLASRYPGYILHDGDVLNIGKEIIYNGILYRCVVSHTYDGEFKEQYFDQISIITDNSRSGEEWLDVSSTTFDNVSKSLTVVLPFPSNRLNAIVDIVVYDITSREILASDLNTSRKSQYVITSDLLNNYENKSKLRVTARIKQVHEYSPKLDTPTISSIEFYLKSTKMLIKLSNHNFRNRYYKVDIVDNDNNRVTYENLIYDEDLGGLLVPTTNEIIKLGSLLTVKVQTYQ